MIRVRVSQLTRRLVCGAFVVVAALLMTGCGKPSGPAGYFKTHFQDESQFIVETVVSDLAEMVFYAKHRELPEPKNFAVNAAEKTGSQFRAPVYDVSVTLKKGSTAKFTTAIEAAIWSPGTYDTATKALMDLAALSKDKRLGEDDDGKLLGDLTDAQASTIERANESVSQELAADFQNPTSHEKAALVLGALALKEASGQFYDVRLLLCRMTAHLAFARALRAGGEASISGQVADVMLETLMNREKTAVEKLDQINSANPQVAAWQRALRSIVTMDYRPISKLQKPTPIERIAKFQAYSCAISANRAWSELTTNDLKYPDFCRTVSCERYSVETGHGLLRLQLAGEFRDLAKVYELVHGRQLQKDSFVAELNEMPSRCVTSESGKAKIAVIGWGQWAMFYQRHLCHAVADNFAFMEHKWGVHEDAVKFAANSEQLLGNLRLYPFVRRFTCTDETSYHRAIDDAFPVTVATPHLVAPCIWNYLCYRVSFAPVYQPNPNPHINEWHKHNPPPGTVYDMQPRLDHPSLMDRADTSAQLEQLHEMAPYDAPLTGEIIYKKYGTNVTGEVLESLYGPVLEYCSTPLAECARAFERDPAKYEALMRKACELDPEFYLTLHNYFVKRRDDDKAIIYWEKANELSGDSVSVSSYALWVVKYYLKKGNKDRAREVADMGGEVYSHRGLLAKAWFLEATENYRGAFDWYQKIEERYENSGPLISFCLRHAKKTGDQQFSQEVKKRMTKIFPKGMKHVSLKDFSGPPKRAVRLNGYNDLTEEAGLKSGDLVVAIEGIQVETAIQYEQVRDSDDSLPMTLIVWQDGQYRELKASPPNRLFGIDLGDFKAR